MNDDAIAQEAELEKQPSSGVIASNSISLEKNKLKHKLVSNEADFVNKKNFTVLGSLLFAAAFAFTAYSQNIVTACYNNYFSALKLNEKNLILEKERLLADKKSEVSSGRLNNNAYDEKSCNKIDDKIDASINPLNRSNELKPKNSLKSFSLESAIAGFESEKEEYVMIVYKSSQRARLFRISYSLLDEVPVSTGKNLGEKQREGDKKTPIGVYRVVSVENSADWLHNNEMAYGPFFLRLDCGSWDLKGSYDRNGLSSIGIHGTNHPELLGQNVSEGCLRTPNNWLKSAVEKNYLAAGTKVMILSEDFIMPSHFISSQNLFHSIIDSENSFKNDVSVDYFKDLLNNRLKEKNEGNILKIR